MPGVVVTTAVRTGPTGVNVAPASTFFVAGTAERGPINEAKLVTSLADFETYYGEYNASYSLHQQVQTFFEEGGARAYVARAVGASATAGSLSLNATGPVAALTITAKNPGSWSSTVTATVTVGSGFTVNLFKDGILFYTTGAVATVAAAVDGINGSSVASVYVSATALLPASTLIATASTPLSTGNNGVAPTATELVTSLDLFGSEYGAGAVAIPGQFGSTIWNGLITHAAARNRVALLAFDPAADATTNIATAANFGTTIGSEFAAAFYPHVTIPGPGTTTLTISPEGYAAAKRSLAHNQIGPWRAGAGVLSQADFVTGLSTSVNKTTGDALDVGRVNAIRLIQGTVRIYGARSLSSDETNYRYITYRDLLNYIVVEAERVLEDLVFSPIDGRGTVFGRTEARLIGLLDPIRTNGGLYEAFDADGNQLDPGYSVEVSNALNPVSQLAVGLVKAKVGVRVSSVADRIEVVVVKSNLTSSVV